MRRKLFSLAATVSFALLFLTSFMWVRSYVTRDLTSFFTRDKWETLIWHENGVITFFGSWPPDEKDKHPFEITDFSIRYWMLTLMTGLLPAAWIAFRFITARTHSQRRQRQQCPNCGYDLRATPDRCPECGSRVRIAPPDT